MSSIGPIACPQCNSSDQLRKVSTLVDEGSAHGSTGGTVKTDLASKLSMPTMPQVQTNTGMEIGCGCLATLLACTLVGLGIGALIKNLTTGNIIGGVLFWISFITVIVIVLTRNSRQKQWVQEEQKRWHKVKSIWDSLYYCGRNGIVFSDRDTSNYVQADQMKDWLRRQ